MKFRLIESDTIEVDSDGNVLSVNQSKFFANSKVRDNTGRLLVCLHGSRVSGGLSVLDPRRCNRSNLYFSNSKDVANHFSYNDASAIYTCYLNMDNPLIVDADSSRWDKISFRNSVVNVDDLADIARKENNDGVIIKNVIEYNNYFCDDYIVFRADQVKSIENKFPTSKPGLFESSLAPRN